MKAIRSRQVLDGRGGPPLVDGVILVDGERVRQIGPAGRVQVPPDAEVIDVGDETVLPELIDCHNHLSLSARVKDYLLRVTDPEDELLIRAVANLRVDLKAGVTTSRYLGEKSFLDVVCRKMVQAGAIPGPRIYTASRGLRSSSGHGYVGTPTNGSEAIGRAIRENFRRGADLVKLFVTDTAKVHGRIPHYYSRAEIQTAVEEAHRVGKKVSAHAIGGEGLRNCLELGVDCIEHGYFVEDVALDLMVKNGVPLVITSNLFSHEGRVQNLHSPGLAERFRTGRDEMQRCMERAIKSGLTYALGTDALHGGLVFEMEFLTRLGASPMEAFVAATRHGAEVCGIGSEMGTLEAGKWADLISVKGNPLDDIGAMRHVGLIMKAGARYDSISEF
ncbi:MAG: amidohydrolase family protein [Candidatus Methylomirabilia bacterium]